MLDWTTLTRDPNDKQTALQLQAFLRSLLSFYASSRNDFLSAYFRGARVLDIGAGEHDPSYFNSDRWEHGVIHRAAASMLGVDINEEVCEHYNRAGYRFRCVDATSDTDLGERFDRVFMGDVIEHVENPVALLKFAKRHLDPAGGGRILVTTPNPFSISCLTARLRRRIDRPFFITNFEHVGWITPTNANELARRAGLRLTGIYFPRRRLSSIRSLKSLVKGLIDERLLPTELGSREYIYEFALG